MHVLRRSVELATVVGHSGSDRYRLPSSQGEYTGIPAITICFGMLLLIDTIGRVGTITNSADSAYYTVELNRFAVASFPHISR